MKKLKNIIAAWGWVNIMFGFSILFFIVTASATENLLFTAYTLSYFSVIASLACMMALPIYYAVTAKNRVVVTFFAVLVFNAIGSILMYFYFKKSLRGNE